MVHAGQVGKQVGKWVIEQVVRCNKGTYDHLRKQWAEAEPGWAPQGRGV